MTETEAYLQLILMACILISFPYLIKHLPPRIAKCIVTWLIKHKVIKPFKSKRK